MKKLKITSLILVAVMVIGMLPLGMFAISAAEAVPATLPNSTVAYHTSRYFGESKTLANGENWFGGKTAQWRGADGLLIKINGGATASELQPQVQLPIGQSSNIGSYVRGMVANEWASPTYFGYLTSTVYLWDGTTWTSQTTDNVKGNDVANSVNIPASFDGYLYIPMDQFWFAGPGNNSKLATDDNPYLYQTNLVDYLSQSASQTIGQMNLQALSDVSATISSVDFAYNNVDLSPAANDVMTNVPFTSLSKADSIASSAWDAATDTVTLSNIQSSNGTGVLVWNTFADSYTDLSDVKGIMINVNATGVATDGDVYFRMFLQCNHGAANGPYASGNLIGKYQDQTSAIPNGIYETNGSSSWMQYVTRSAASVAYIKDAAGKWTPVYAEGTNYNNANETAFKLPANYNGPVYIPMDSYYLNLVNNSSATMVAWKDCLLKDTRAVGYSPYVTGNATAKTMVLSDFKFVYDNSMETVEIGTAEQLLNFFNNLGNYEGKKVVLTSDITLNEGWDAKAATVTEPTTKLESKAQTFAGVFDGQGHTISGLYLKSELRATGFFGSVPTGKTATVKNLSIVNSYIESDKQATGGIFGEVQAESQTKITDPHYVNKTKAYIDNVYADIRIVNTYAGRGAGDGVGGFIGCCGTDADIRNSIFAGDITSKNRGVSAMIGAMYIPQSVEANVENYKANVHIYNCAFSGSLSATDQGFTGAIVGYFNPCTVFMKVDRFSSLGSINKTSIEGKNGILLGGSWTGGNNSRDGIGTDISKVILTNITYVQNGNVTDLVGQATNGFRIYLNNNFAPYKSGAVKTTALTGYTTNDLPDILMIRDKLNWQYSMSVIGGSGMVMNFYLKADQLVLKEGGRVFIKVRPGRSGTDAQAVSLEATLQADGYYKASMPVDPTRAGDEWKVEVLKTAPGAAKAVSTLVFNHAATDIRPTVKKYLTTLLNDENSSDELKDLAADILRWTDYLCDEYLAVTTSTYKPTEVLTDAEAEALTAGNVIVPGTAPTIVGTDFTDMTMDMETGIFTVTVGANAGVCSATLNGEAVIMTYANGKLTIDLSDMEDWTTAGKTLTVTNGTSSISAPIGNLLDPEDPESPMLALLYAYATSVVAYAASIA